MLILAGTTIAIMMSGGLLTNAREAAKQANIEQSREKIELEIANVQIDKHGQATLQDLEAARNNNNRKSHKRRKGTILPS